MLQRKVDRAVNSAVFENSRGVSFMSNSSPFKWRHFEAEIILLCVRWYLRYALSYRDLEEMMLERGLHVDHTTIFRLPSNATLPSWRSAAGRISKRPMIPGASTRPTSRSRKLLTRL
jgi:hypothetical protein